MALFVMILRKMVKNKWLECSLLLGLILSVAMVSSMPIYINAILERLLVKDLENLQQNTGDYPGKIWSSVYFTDEVPLRERGKAFRAIDDFIRHKADEFPLPTREYVRDRRTDDLKAVPLHPDKIDASKNRRAGIGGISDLENHIRLVDGRMPAAQPVNGVYEALVTEASLTKLNMVLGNEFILIDDYDNDKEKVTVKAVGVIDRKAYDDVYWPSSPNQYTSLFMIPFSLFEKDFTDGRKVDVRVGYWYLALDYTKFKLEGIEPFITNQESLADYFYNRFQNYNVVATALKTIDSYFDKEKRLRLMLWSLNVPVMIMLAFYLFMVANLITERQKTEIAVLRSRGAGRMQIVASYLVEGLVLGAIAFVVGPFVGLLLTRMLGAANGFLEFVQRAALDVRLNGQSFQYAFGAVACSIVMTLIPVLLATRASIVSHKQQLSRLHKMTFWHKYFLDLVLIALSLYQLSNYRRRMNDLLSMGLDSLDFKVDPLLFLVPALFALGMGLFILRIYPWFVRFVYWVGRKYWPPSLYSTLIQVGRSAPQYQFIMLFLVITIATGLFSASAARTVNKNLEDQLRYQYGADVTLDAMWENDAPPPGGEESPAAQQPVTFSVKKKVQFTEPPFQPFAELTGVDHAAKVFFKQDAYISAGKSFSQTALMGIDTDAFGQTAWLRDGLLDHHFYDYLNLLASDPKAVLISRSIADENGFKPGDTINIGWQDVESAQFRVYGIIDFWPGWNPNPIYSGKPDPNAAKTGAKNGAANKNVKYPKLVVGHLPYIQNNLALLPYSIWLKLKPEVTSQQLYEAMEAKSITVTKINDTKQMLIKQKNDPFRLAINGVMTLGFLISIVISFFGFLLYWVLSLSGRTLQLGILRAMGISFRQLIVMLAGEQILTSGAAILIGAVTGMTTSRLFVPLFKISFNTANQVPPFQVTFDPRDQLQLLFIATAMVLIGLFILGYMLSRLKIHQAVKLGED